MFVGSPVEEDEKTLVKLAKKLKKNNIAVDVINFGEEAENTTKLEAFVAAVNNNDNRFVFVLVFVKERALLSQFEGGYDTLGKYPLSNHNLHFFYHFFCYG